MLKDMSVAEIEGLIDRVQNSIDQGLPIAAEDTRLLLEILKGYLYIQDRLQHNALTITKLKKLLGMISASEKSRDVLGSSSEPAENENKPLEPVLIPPEVKNNRSKHGRKNSSDFENAKTEHHPIRNYHKGDLCPDCQKGRLYKFPPSEFIRITGVEPLQATIHVSERMRCNYCQKIINAPLPPEVLADGKEGQRFGYSAIAMITLTRYGLGFPFFRLQTLQKMLKTPISASTAWDLAEGSADILQYVWKELRRLAAQGITFFCDDTWNRILSAEPIMKSIRGTNKERLRSGVNTSGILSMLEDGKQIALFKTGINHVGEFIDELLIEREGDRPYFHMSDALAMNKPTVGKHIKLHCNAHCRREFVSIKDMFPEEVEEVINVYKKVYAIEAEIKEAKMSDLERLNRHEQESLPLIEALMDDLRKKIEERKVEPNGPLGKAINYFINHKEGLLGFTKYPGAPLDNNEEERDLKRIILHRNNSQFFKNEIGSAVGDIHSSIILTTIKAKENPLNYIATLLKHADEVKKSPDKFLPWNYKETVHQLTEN